MSKTTTSFLQNLFDWERFELDEGFVSFDTFHFNFLQSVTQGKFDFDRAGQARLNLLSLMKIISRNS